MTPTPRRRWTRRLIVAAVALAVLLGGSAWLLGALLPGERLRPLIADQVRQKTGREFEIRGALAIRLLPRIAVVADDLVLGNASWGSRREMLTVGRARLALAIGPLLQGRLAVSEVALDRVDLLLETDRKGSGNWLFEGTDRPATPSTANGDKPPLQIEVDRVRLDGARVTWRDGRSGSSRTLDIAEVGFEPEGDSARLAIRLKLQSTDWTIDGRTGRIADLIAAKADWPIDLHARADGAELAVKGALRAAAPARTLAADVSAKLNRAALLKPWTDATVPLPITLKAHVETKPGSVNADDLQLSIADQALAGRAAVTTEGTTRFDVQLAARSIDLGRWLPAPAAKAAAASAPASAGRRWIFPDAPIPFDTLPEATGTIALRVDQLAAPRLPPVAALSLRAALRPGRLQVDPVTLQVADGNVRASATVTPQPSGGVRVAWRSEASGLAIDALMRAAGTPGYAQGGTVRTTSRLDMAGKTWRALAAGASGEVLLVAENTTLGSGMSPMGTDLLPRLLQVLTGQPQSARRPTKVDCAVVRLPLASGVARVDRSIAIETDQLVASATGEVRLTDETLSLAVRPSARRDIAKAIPLDLASLVVVKGPIVDPSLTLDPKGVAAMAMAIGAAGATGGLSMLAERLLQAPTDPHPCRFAATGQASPAAQPSAPTQPSPQQPALPDLLRKLFKK